MTILLPRLPGPSAECLLDQLLADGAFKWSGFRHDSLPDMVRFAATGGSIVDPGLLRELREGIVAIAQDHGFRVGKPYFATFDAALSAWLGENALLESGEALRDDFWSFAGVVLAPDVVQWRFGVARHRYLGGIRNTFQRLWVRARALDRRADVADRWLLLDALTEDALVQITERPSIGADPILSSALAEGWVRAAHRYGRGRMEGIMRRATLRLRIRNEISCLSTLAHDELAAVLDEYFAEAANARGAEVVDRHSDGQEDADQAPVEASSDEEVETPPQRPRRWGFLRPR